MSSSPERALMPDAAPDDRRIAYVLGSEQGLRIVVHDLSSGATEAISPAGVDTADVRWSPDGSRLAFARVTRAGATLDLIDANGGGWRSLGLAGRADSAARLVAGRTLDRGCGRPRWQRRLGPGADRHRRAGPRSSAHLRAVGGPRPLVASGRMSAAVRAAGLHALAAAVLGAVLVYIIARAVRVPLTYDEATTFYRHVEGAPAALLDFSTAGNHLLNSALTWVAHLLFGSAPLALRLPNVVAGACYLAVVAAIARRMRQPAIGLAAVLLLTTNPYLLEFFALSRGYGLAVALVTTGGWCLARWCEGSRDAPSAERWLAAALGLSAAAVAASYAALVAFVAICGVVVARMAWTARRRPRPPAGRPAPLWGARADRRLGRGHGALQRRRVFARTAARPCVIRSRWRSGWAACTKRN